MDVVHVPVLAFCQAAQLSRYIRSLMPDNLKLDYLRTAWAKGLRERAVLTIHALRIG